MKVCFRLLEMDYICYLKRFLKTNESELVKSINKPFKGSCRKVQLKRSIFFSFLSNCFTWTGVAADGIVCQKPTIMSPHHPALYSTYGLNSTYNKKMRLGEEETEKCRKADKFGAPHSFKDVVSFFLNYCCSMSNNINTDKVSRKDVHLTMPLNKWKVSQGISIYYCL